MEKELRFYAENVQVKDNTREITGYAAKFDTRSKDLGGFIETIKRGAFKNVLQSNPDVIANINHDDSQILARTNNNLELTEDNVGLKFKLIIPKTSYGDDLLVNVQERNISKCSFAFSVGRDEWERRGDNPPLRVIHEIENLYDVALVTTPAYEDTEIALRSLKDYEAHTNVDTATKARIHKVYWL